MNTAVSCVFVNYRTGQRPVGFNTICFWQENVVSLQQTERTGGTNRPFLVSAPGFFRDFIPRKSFSCQPCNFFRKPCSGFYPYSKKKQVASARPFLRAES